MEFQDWLQIARKELSESKIPKRDAEILLSSVTKKSRSFILSFGETRLKDNEIQRLTFLLSRRKEGEPMEYLIGECEFWSLSLYSSPKVLIPRPDTECLVEQALVRIPSGICRILDLGTGTGAIALALASEKPHCEVIATDFYPEAVSLARRNVSRLGLVNVDIRKSYWFDSLDNELFQLIVSNPPYVDEEDFLYLSKGDLRFEPRTALVASNSGLSDLQHIITHAKHYLYSNGWLIVEHSWKQGKIVRSLFIQEGYSLVSTYSDYSGNDRVTLGCNGASPIFFLSVNKSKL